MTINLKLSFLMCIPFQILSQRLAFQLLNKLFIHISSFIKKERHLKISKKKSLFLINMRMEKKILDIKHKTLTKTSLTSQ